MSEIRLNPNVGDKFIARPQYKYDLPITVLFVGDNGLSVITKKGTTMFITISDWNKHVNDKIISTMPESTRGKE